MGGADETRDDTPRDTKGLRPGAIAFADYLAQHDAGKKPDLEDFCARHPHLATELRLMHRLWQGGHLDLG